MERRGVRRESLRKLTLPHHARAADTKTAEEALSRAKIKVGGRVPTHLLFFVPRCFLRKITDLTRFVYAFKQVIIKLSVNDMVVDYFIFKHFVGYSIWECPTFFVQDIIFANCALTINHYFCLFNALNKSSSSWFLDVPCWQ